MGCLQDLQISPADEYSAVLNCGVGPVEDMRVKVSRQVSSEKRIRVHAFEDAFGTSHRRQARLQADGCGFLAALAQVGVPKDAGGHGAPGTPRLLKFLQPLR